MGADSTKHYGFYETLRVAKVLPPLYAFRDPLLRKLGRKSAFYATSNTTWRTRISCVHYLYEIYRLWNAPLVPIAPPFALLSHLGPSPSRFSLFLMFTGALQHSTGFLTQVVFTHTRQHLSGNQAAFVFTHTRHLLLPRCLGRTNAPAYCCKRLEFVASN